MRTSDGLDLYVEIDDGPDPTVIFCHGWMGWLGEWQVQREALAGRARLVFYDHRGHGQSTRTGKSTSSVQHLARDLAEVIEEVAPTGRVILVGHSMGSMTIQQLAATHPEIFGEHVVGVLLANTLARGLRGPNALLNRYSRTFRPAKPVIALAIRSQRSRLGRALMPRVRADSVPGLIQTLGAHGTARTFVDFHRVFVDLDVEDAAKALASVDTVIVGGSADHLTPLRHGERLAASIPDARLRVVPGAGHWVPAERPEVITDLIVEQLERL